MKSREILNRVGSIFENTVGELNKDLAQIPIESLSEKTVKRLDEMFLSLIRERLTELRDFAHEVLAEVGDIEFPLEQESDTAVTDKRETAVGVAPCNKDQERRVKPSISEDATRVQRREMAIPLLEEGKSPTEVAEILTSRGVPTKPRQIAILNAGLKRRKPSLSSDKTFESNDGSSTAVPTAAAVAAWHHLKPDHLKVIRGAILTDPVTCDKVTISQRCGVVAGAIEPLLNIAVPTLLTILQVSDVGQLNAIERELRSEINERFGDQSLGEIRARLREARIVVTGKINYK